MISFFMIKKPKAPKGVMAPEKFGRLLGLQKALGKRAEAVQVDFEKTPEAQKLIRSLGRSSAMVSKMLPKRSSKRDPKYEKKLQRVLLENASSYLRFMQKLKDFAEAKNANPRFINFIKSRVTLAEENLASVRKMGF